MTVSGILRTQDGVGRFELDEAAVSGVPVPPSVLQDIVALLLENRRRPGQGCG